MSEHCVPLSLPVGSINVVIGNRMVVMPLIPVNDFMFVCLDEVKQYPFRFLEVGLPL